MQLQYSIWLFHAILGCGLAAWLTLATINNLHGFHGSVWAIGNTMRMDPLRQDPTLQSPLLRRALTSLALHRLALIVVLPWLNLALCGMATFLLLMHLGGLWFAYWIAQDGLQTTHLVLLLWTMALFAVFNF